MRFAKKIVSILLVIAMMAALCLGASAAEDKKVRNRYNVVFVTDESGSMRNTDPTGLRYEAIRRFVALMAQQGNYVGSVNFSTGILASQSVQPVIGFNQKEVFVENLNTGTASGYTNIGAALMQAVQMLDEGANQDNPSVIILLTDGNTEMPDDEGLQESRDQKAEAIELARKAGYQIYTISLNVNGAADNTELMQIASATGGEFQEVTDAADLEEIQTMYYKMIFGAVEGDDAEDIEINAEGYAEKEFDVPGIGVEEFNVLLEGEVSSYSLTDSSGHTYTDAELDQMTMSGQDFVVIKVENPMGGTWKVTVHGDPGTEINFRLLYNSDFYVTTTASAQGDCKLNDTVTFGLTVCDSSGPITDTARYDGFSAQLHVSVNGVEETYNMSLQSGGFTYDYTLTEQGTYYAYMTVTNGDYSATSDETYAINVENEAPVPSGAELKDHANIWPFVGGSASIDLSGAATDPNGDAITYSVESTAFLPEDYTLEGNTLTVNNFSISKGSFTIRATDPYGAYCTLEASFTSTNIGLVMAIVTVIGILVAAIVLVVLLRIALSTPFMGTVTVEKYDAEDTSYPVPVVRTPGRGRCTLASFDLGTCGLPAGSYFQAGGKDKHIYFISKKTPVYSDAVAGATKKVPIDGNGLEVMIYADANMEKGIRVTFQSMLNNQFDF